MAINKKNNFEKEAVKLAEYAKAISHPARIMILQYLAEKNRCICGEIVNIVPLAQSTVSQHLNELKKIGLISGEVDGPKSCYCINKAAFDEMKNLFSKFSSLIDIETITCNCGEVEK